MQVNAITVSAGQERWHVAGDASSYAGGTVAIARHSDHPWHRLYALVEAATKIATLAASRKVSVDHLLEEIVETIDDRETQRISRDRLAADSEPLEDVADRFGIDLKTYEASREPQAEGDLSHRNPS